MNTYEKLKEDIKLRILSDIILNNGKNIGVKKQILIPNDSSLMVNFPNEKVIKVPYSLLYELIVELTDDKEIDFDYCIEKIFETERGVLRYLKSIKDDDQMNCYEKLKQQLNSSSNDFQLPVTTEEIDTILYKKYLIARDINDKNNSKSNYLSYSHKPVTASFLKKICYDGIYYNDIIKLREYNHRLEMTKKVRER